VETPDKNVLPAAKASKARSGIAAAVGSHSDSRLGSSEDSESKHPMGERSAFGTMQTYDSDAMLFAQERIEDVSSSDVRLGGGERKCRTVVS
jgi:hypothetical protein